MIQNKHNVQILKQTVYFRMKQIQNKFMNTLILRDPSPTHMLLYMACLICIQYYILKIIYSQHTIHTRTLQLIQKHHLHETVYTKTVISSTLREATFHKIIQISRKWYHDQENHIRILLKHVIQKATDNKYEGIGADNRYEKVIHMQLALLKHLSIQYRIDRELYI